MARFDFPVQKKHEGKILRAFLSGMDYFMPFS